MRVVAGSQAGQWFPEGFVPEILELVLATWAKLRLESDVLLEPRITNLLSQALEEEYTLQGKDWYVFPEIKEADPISGKEISRTDIRFYHRSVPGQKLYFAFESKRLHVPAENGSTRAGYSEYAGFDGMMCFITGKYSQAAEAGGMLGYVMDGQLAYASEKIRETIRACSADLALAAAGSYTSSPWMPEHPWNGETRHDRRFGAFTMFHLLLSVPAARVAA